MSAAVRRSAAIVLSIPITADLETEIMNKLIVEDSEPMRRTIRSFLEDLVEEIHECRDGRNALAAFTR